MTVGLAVAVFAAGIAIGRSWQRRQRQFHWNDLAAKERRIIHLEHDLAQEKKWHRATARKGDTWRERAQQLGATKPARPMPS